MDANGAPGEVEEIQRHLAERGLQGHLFRGVERNTLDINAIPSIHKLSHLPIVADPSHGTGRWELVAPVANAAVAAGADGLIVEVHPNPDMAKSDGAQSLTFQNFAKLMTQVNAVREALNSGAGALA
jgi:3-deoxy-7-phosphoheptulonate synthase